MRKHRRARALRASGLCRLHDARAGRSRVTDGAPPGRLKKGWRCRSGGAPLPCGRCSPPCPYAWVQAGKSGAETVRPPNAIPLVTPRRAARPAQGTPEGEPARTARTEHAVRPESGSHSRGHGGSRGARRGPNLSAPFAPRRKGNAGARLLHRANPGAVTPAERHIQPPASRRRAPPAPGTDSPRPSCASEGSVVREARG